MLCTFRSALNKALRLTVYSRVDCHLCEVMVAQLRDLQPPVPLEVEIIDIGGNSTLEARYGKRVPVLVAGDRELCQYRLDPGKLDEFLDGIQQGDGTLPSRYAT